MSTKPRILIKLPTWLGDAVMATPAIEALCHAYPNAQLTFVGSALSAPLFTSHPQANRVFIDSTKESGNRLKGLYALAQVLGRHDFAITFQNSFLSALLLTLTKTPIRIGFAKEFRSFLLSHSLPYPHKIHQVQRYFRLTDILLPSQATLSALKLYTNPHYFKRPTVGINAGAIYGDAKRWYPERFAEVAKTLSSKFDIALVGSHKEIDMVQTIYDTLVSQGITNVTNYAGKTDIPQLISLIAGFKLFITNDSGPMHVATAFHVPLVAIFGSTDWLETAPWNHSLSRIVRYPVECAPCKKRICPTHHECMKGVTAEMVIDAVKEVIKW